MTTIIQKMWRDGVPGPDGGLVRIAERKVTLPAFKCDWCDGLTLLEGESLDPLEKCANCGKFLFEMERL